MTFVFWVVILALLAGAIAGWVGHHKVEREIARSMRELEDEV